MAARIPGYLLVGVPTVVLPKRKTLTKQWIIYMSSTEQRAPCFPTPIRGRFPTMTVVIRIHSNTTLTSHVSLPSAGRFAIRDHESTVLRTGNHIVGIFGPDKLSWLARQ